MLTPVITAKSEFRLRDSTGFVSKVDMRLREMGSVMLKELSILFATAAVVSLLLQLTYSLKTFVMAAILPSAVGLH